MAEPIRRILRTRKFKRQYNKLLAKHYDDSLFEDMLDVLVARDTELLRTRYHDHQLRDRKGLRELHVDNDWLLLYQIDGKQLILYLLETGSHDDVL